jgi:ATP phosphoribosyltransferase regulatory subunit
MGDLLPPEAAARRALAGGVLQCFELCGYELVIPPVFEHAEVMQRGNDALDNRDMFRFVEPESGEVAVLRPDITPQIARIVATRLADHRPPIRLSYEGRIFRRQRGRARSHRHVSQVGVECVGLGEVEGDTEVLALAIRACEQVGLREFRVELSDIRLVRSLLQGVPEAARGALSDVLAQKDAAALAAIAKNRGVSRELALQLGALLECYGERDVLVAAQKRFRSPEAKAALRSLRLITDALHELGVGQRICFDLSETRGLSYYTGMRFCILARGPGEELGSGGRYDNLLARFGADLPATGFALDLGNLQWTLREQDGPDAAPAGAPLRVVVGGGDRRGRQAGAERLRAAGLVAAGLPDSDPTRCLAFARSWGYDAVVLLTRGSPRLLRTHGRANNSGTAPALRGDASFETLTDLDPELVRRLLRGPGNRRAAPRAKD